MNEIAPGIWMWRAAHPEWRPGRELAVSYALAHDDGVALVDPLLPQRSREEVLTELTRTVGRYADPPHVLVTIPYHARSAAELAALWPEATVWGHPATSSRLPRGVRFRAINPSKTLPFGVRAFTFGSPVRFEHPLWFPHHHALAFGDAVVGVRQGLRVWAAVRDEKRRRWYSQRFLPTLRPLLELEPQHVLVTHGTPVLGTGSRALARALERDPIEF